MELVLLGLLVAVAALAIVARIVNVPYPILLVIGGLGIGFAPGVPEVELDPDLVLLIFLPPLLYSAAFFSSLRDLRANLRPIGMLSVGLVLATMGSVAVVSHAVIDGLPWEAAFVLGAIVSPTDPLAATAVARRLGVPRRVVTIVEGESLINDGTALVLYKVAVAAVVGGTFSAWEAGGSFVVSSAGGVAIGLAAGWVVANIRRRLDDPPVEITVSLFTAYAAYLPAEELGVSGVLAAVTVGIYLGWRASELTEPTTRIQAFAVWEILVFLLNSFVFVLVGMQLPGILDELSGDSATTLAGYAALISAVVIGTRVAWVFGLTYLPTRFSPRLRERVELPEWRQVWLIAWIGMRGAVSLAAALALPLETDAGTPFPERDLIVFLAFAVIMATLVLQGLTLTPMVLALDLEDDHGPHEEELEARLEAAAAAIARLEELTDEPWVRDDTAQRMRGLYEYRQRRFSARQDGDDDGELERRSAAFQRLRRELLNAERQALVDLRNAGRISDEVLRVVERDLDLEDTRLET